MSRRLFYWFAGILALGLVALVPLRMALGRLAQQGFTARQVAGTIWNGRIGELNFKSRRLGTFDVALEPLALLTGAVELGFHRLDDPQGVLDGTLVSGGDRGFRETTGRIGMAGLFGTLPLDAIEFDKVSVLFKGQNCAKAAGQVTVLLAAPLPGVDGMVLRGSPRCENTRVRFVLSTPANAGKLEFYVRSSGDYRAWFRVRGAQPDQSANLVALGFSPSQEGLMMSVDGTAVSLAGAILGAISGAIVGSFLATLVIRWPKGEQAVAGRSRCDRCHRQLGPLELVPIVSRLWLRGRCRACGAAIDPTHAQLEICAAIVGAAALWLAPDWSGLVLALFGWLLLPLAWLDWRHLWLPHRLVLPLALGGLAFGGLLGASLVDRIIGGLAGWAALSLLVAGLSTGARTRGAGTGRSETVGRDRFVAGLGAAGAGAGAGRGAGYRGRPGAWAFEQGFAAVRNDAGDGGLAHRLVSTGRRARDLELSEPCGDRCTVGGAARVREARRQRVDPPSRPHDLEMQMRAGRETRCPDKADDLSAPDPAARLGDHVAEVRIARCQPLGVGELDLASIAPAPFRRRNAPVGGRPHRRAPAGGEVDALVRPQEAQDRVGADAEGRTDAAADRLRKGGFGTEPVRIDPAIGRARPFQQAQRPAAGPFERHEEQLGRGLGSEPVRPLARDGGEGIEIPGLFLDQSGRFEREPRVEACAPERPIGPGGDVDLDLPGRGGFAVHFERTPVADNRSAAEVAQQNQLLDRPVPA